MLVLSLCRRFVIPAIPEILFRSGDLTLSHDTATMLVFSLVVAWSAWRMLGPSTLSEKVKEHSPLRLLATGLMLGLLTGLLGVGGGFIIIPALVLFLGLDMNIAVNTSLSIISLNTLFGLISSIDDLAALDAGLCLRIIVIATIGMMAGIAFRQRMPAARLKQIFAWMLLSLAVLIFLKEGFELLG